MASEQVTHAKAGPTQEKWFALVERTGSRDAARKELARQLRLAADIVERPGFPDVFACEVTTTDDWGADVTAGIGVVLSYPWPG